MHTPTPSELRKREKGIKSFDEHWEIIGNTFEIRHIQLKGWSKFIDYFWRKKHKVSDLYWWWSRQSASLKWLYLNDAIKHDDLPLEGFPRKYQMLNKWSILTEDLKYLYEGPLVDQTGHKTLVKHQSRIAKFVSVTSQLRPLGWLIPLILACFRYRNEIIELWNKLLSNI